MNPFRLRGALVVAVMLGVAGGVVAQQGDTLRIMSQNMDEGTGFQELIAAQTPQEFVAAVTLTYQNILATKPTERAAAMAREIAKAHPDIVGLQEASMVRTGTTAPATHVE